MDTAARETPKLEIALLRRGIHELSAERERCDRCRRTPLIGERVYGYAEQVTLCELCRALEPATARASWVVHGPEFGHTLRVIDRRAA